MHGIYYFMPDTFKQSVIRFNRVRFQKLQSSQLILKEKP